MQWILGFAEAPEHHRALERHFFPSKLGGMPAWLDPEHVPPPEECLTSPDGKYMDFLLQVYAPVDGNDEAFHRTMYVFVPQEGTQAEKPGYVRAFRCQLPRVNSYYSDQPPREGDPCPLLTEEQEWGAARISAWEHFCGQQRFPFKESELVVEEEGPEEELERECPSESEGKGDNDDHLAAMLEAQGEPSEDAKAFASFCGRVQRHPGQCLRYCFDTRAQPLWPFVNNPPSWRDVPPCHLCGSRRVFEFQVLPHALSFVGQDDESDSALDFGSLVVYSCARSCPTFRNGPDGCSYVEEHTIALPPLDAAGKVT